MATVTIHKIANLEPRDSLAWWCTWGQDGKKWSEENGYHDPRRYYGRLCFHMQQGGEIPPIKVGPWKHGEQGQLYVFDGHHRFAIARMVGWFTIPTVAAEPEYYDSQRWEPL